METVKINPKRCSMFKSGQKAVLRTISERLGVDAAYKDGSVEIDGEGGAEWVAAMVVSAINLGFEPAKAYKLFSDNYYLEIIDLDLYFARNEKLIERYAARVIGLEGKSKRVIEELSDAYISVWEHKIGIIGTFEDLSGAREAVNRLLQGSTHAGVFAFLEKQRKLKRLPR
jgi:ribosomal RNA assembly protein